MDTVGRAFLFFRMFILTTVQEIRHCDEKFWLKLLKV